MQMLPRSLPGDLDDLTVQVALVRPGPIQGGAVHPYLERRRRLREDPSYEVPYEHPSLEPILSDTLGAIVFQDQVIQVAMALAGFSAGEAEGLRRAMSRKRSRGGDQRLPRAVPGRRGRARGRAGGRGARLRADPWLLRLRLPEVARRRVRPARLPVDLAAGASRAGVPVRAPERAADGLLSARRAGPRGAAARDRGAGAGCERERGRVLGRGRSGRADRARVRDTGCARRTRRRSSPSASAAGATGARRAGVARGRSRRRARAARLGRGVRVGRAGRRGVARRPALWRLGVAGGVGAARAALAAARAAGGAARWPSSTTGTWRSPTTARPGMTLGAASAGADAPAAGRARDQRRTRGRLPDGASLEVAGIVVARQRPATAQGVVFMLLEDEFGVVNVVVPPPVYASCRLAVRTASVRAGARAAGAT